MRNDVPTVGLSHGAQMPQVGLGTWPMDDAETAEAVVTAIECGYRLFDTAENYRNESGVGQGIKEAGIPRNQVFITTKFNKQWHSVDGARQAFESAAERLGTDYIDLLMIHWPNPDQDRYVDAWKGMVQLLKEGLIKAVGTSNFKPAHLDRIIAETGVAPDVNQINLNPYATRDATVNYHREHKIVTESWSPIKPSSMLHERVITELAELYQRTPAQIVLRWHTQLGFVTVPKSATPSRIRDNISIFNFELTTEQLESISALNRGEAHVTDSDGFGH
ncbi:aldo/keto reductase [Microlunatus elymi]|uniref:Aldo/keto reductase n=1 Tax=Microlunatus elymi TaxID=2596828 RepID=A0A516PVJ7_9ACTN|nr:aldo/keto reductase [Microlunatus elymi]QDP95215.1 aldo/keto reductase [Microlunatus elymi]